ncbi:MAG TPA: YqiA/YcfP family alpha/beta fold hydrolase [Albitalea sp.]
MSNVDLPQPAITHLLYLHGFRSSPQSMKAGKIGDWMRVQRPDVRWWCPQLPASPQESLELVMNGIAGWPRDRMAVIGSSLGGFYATVVAERIGCRAVLLNPAIEPARDLEKFIGETTAWHSDERFFFRSEFVDQLRTLRPGQITRPQRYYAVIAKGDEVLDWREMSARYAGCRIKLLDSGDHALSDFDVHWPEIAKFIGITN